MEGTILPRTRGGRRGQPPPAGDLCPVGLILPCAASGRLGSSTLPRSRRSNRPASREAVQRRAPISPPRDKDKASLESKRSEVRGTRGARRFPRTAEMRQCRGMTEKSDGGDRVRFFRADNSQAWHTADKIRVKRLNLTQRGLLPGGMIRTNADPWESAD